MNKKRLFTNYFDTKVGNKEMRVSRVKKGELLDSVAVFGSDVPEEEESRQKISYRYLYFICLAVVAILLFKLSDLQLFRGGYFFDLSKGNRIRFQIVRAPRGLIFDSKGNPFVKNIANFQVILEPFDLPKDKGERAEIINSLATDLEIPKEELEKIVSSQEKSGSLDPKVIKENLDQAQALKIKVKYKDFSAVSVDASPTREYLDPNLSHVLGYIGRVSKEEYEKNRSFYDINDYAGMNGLESSYEQYLKGQNGKRMVEVDAEGKVRRILGSEEQSEPKAGSNIVTSLNVDLEREMVDALRNAINSSPGKAGSAVAINPQNGNILGMVSLPSYDNNIFVKGVKPEEYKALSENPLKPLFNRAISGTYPPGSIIKPVIASGGLQEGVITPSTTISAPGQIVVKNQYNLSIEYVFKDWKASGHGNLNVIGAIAESADTFFYQVGGGFEKFKGLGATRLENYLRLFGLGSKTGIDLPSEDEGLVPTPDWKKKVKGESWYTADNYHLSIGQGDLLVTPLQAASWTATIASGGIFYKPRIVTAVTNNEGKVVKQFSPEIVRQGFINPNHINTVRQGMRVAVTSGTGRLLSSLSVEAAAKTGTAQYGPNNSKQHAWFITFAPFNNPEIALAVIVEGGGEGNQVAAPVAKQILEYYFSHK